MAIFSFFRQPGSPASALLNNSLIREKKLVRDITRWRSTANRLLQNSPQQPGSGCIDTRFRHLLNRTSSSTFSTGLGPIRSLIHGSSSRPTAKSRVTGGRQDGRRIRESTSWPDLQNRLRGSEILTIRKTLHAN